MPKPTIHATIRYAWWWQFYRAGVLAACFITGQQPNDERVRYWAKRAITIVFDKTNEASQ
jgi:hypothetical protein